MKRLQWLCRYLLDENASYADVSIPDGTQQQRQLFRALMNVRPPLPVSDEFLRLQDEELQEQLAEKGIVEMNRKGLVEWQGDITRLRVDAIVNAANSRMLGCFVPLHRCIDNAIHSAAGVQLRLACAAILRFAQNETNGTYEEPTGNARITPGFNLPAKYVLHRPHCYHCQTSESAGNPACILLQVLSGTLRHERSAQHCLLLHFHR